MKVVNTASTRMMKKLSSREKIVEKTPTRSADVPTSDNYVVSVKQNIGRKNPAIALRAYEEILSAELGKNTDAQLGKIPTSSLWSIANGSRECAPVDRLCDASRRMDATHGLAALLRERRASARLLRMRLHRLSSSRKVSARITPGWRSPCPAPLAQQRAARSEPDRASMTRNRVRSHGRTPPMRDRRRVRRRCRP